MTSMCHVKRDIHVKPKRLDPLGRPGVNSDAITLVPSMSHRQCASPNDVHVTLKLLDALSRSMSFFPVYYPSRCTYI